MIVGSGSGIQQTAAPCNGVWSRGGSIYWKYRDTPILSISILLHRCFWYRFFFDISISGKISV